MKLAGDVMVTGGLGFLGSAFARLAARAGARVMNLDAFTYAADERRLAELPSGAVRTEHLDVAEDGVAEAVERAAPSMIVHFAAESHVTRSERHPDLFYHSNVEGTRRVLEASEAAGTELVVHVSTDEVYGPCEGSPFKEEDKLPGEGLATSAYARSKALADDLARSYRDRVPVTVVRPTNCYGPWQHPEKAIPRWATRVLRGERVPVWGDGMHTRDWMHVDDACRGIRTVVERGAPGEVYNLGPQGEQLPNVAIARALCELAGAEEGLVYLTAYDRRDHDRRYAIDSGRLRALGWSPRHGLVDGLSSTLEWYRRNVSWWAPLVEDADLLYRDDAERSLP
jgi:dTDP-glucose 4,6-dehydratase